MKKHFFFTVILSAPLISFGMEGQPKQAVETQGSVLTISLPDEYYKERALFLLQEAKKKVGEGQEPEGDHFLAYLESRKKAAGDILNGDISLEEKEFQILNPVLQSMFAVGPKDPLYHECYPALVSNAFEYELRRNLGCCVEGEKELSQPYLDNCKEISSSEYDSQSPEEQKSKFLLLRISQKLSACALEALREEKK